VKRFAAIAAFAVLFAFGAEAWPRFGKWRANESSVVKPKSIENNIISADQVGNWWALKADGTMLAGSALTMAAQGSPGVSPITLNGSTQYYSSGSVAFPTASYSIATVVNVTSLASAQQIVAEFSVVNKFLLRAQGSGSAFNFTAYDSGGNAAVATSGAETAGIWLAICATWDSTTNPSIATIRVANVTTSGGSLTTGTQAGSAAQFVGAYNATPAQPLAGQLRGIFFTEKKLSDADCDRITSGAM